MPPECHQVLTPWSVQGWCTLLHFVAFSELCLDLEAEVLLRTQCGASCISRVLKDGNCPLASTQPDSSVMLFGGCLAQAFRLI